MQKFKPRYNQNVNLTIKSIGINGEGVGYWHKHTLFVDAALPGEVVRGRIFDCSKKFSRVKAESISNPSPDRVEPPCKYFGDCGGCQLMHLSYEGQLHYKQQRVLTAVSKFSGLAELDVAPCEPSPKPLHYRNKILIPVRGTASGIQMGLYARNSHDLVSIEGCQVHCPLGEEIYGKVCDIIKDSGITPYDHSNEQGILRFVLIKSAESTSQALVTLIVKNNESPLLNALAEKIMLACPSVKGVVVNIQPDPGNTALGEIYETLLGQGWIEEKLCGLIFKVSPASFFQVNAPQAKNIYDKAVGLACLTGNETLLDAYCGVGTLALCASGKARAVFGVESVPEAIEDAKINAELNGIRNTDFICAKTEDIISSLPQLDAAFVNPPRKGCEASFLTELAKKRPSSIVYISCDPATLGRDIGLLHTLGYRPHTFYPFDMFPQTAHVETVVKLSYAP